MRLPALREGLDGQVTITLGAKGVIEVELVSSGERWGRVHWRSAAARHGPLRPGHGSGAHAPDDYYVIESTHLKVLGIDGAVRSSVEYLYEVARAR